MCWGILFDILTAQAMGVEMDETSASDASILWDDVLELLKGTEMQPATLAMLRSCTPTTFTDGTLTVATNLAFARRKIMQHAPAIEASLEQAAFEHVNLAVELMAATDAPLDTGATVSADELGELAGSDTNTAASVSALTAPTTHTAHSDPADRRRANPLYEDVPVGSSKLTFERFVAGEENMMALEAAKQVANGANKSYNPLFIHGRSGLGKTHLLRAIQNYITTNDTTRLCVYRTAGDFVDEYVSAVRDTAAELPKSALTRHYQDVDVLIIDDVQNMSTAAGSIRFFFETFNYLTAHGKQVVLAADRSPSQLGMGDSAFDERDTSRMDSGMTVSVQVPNYELKYNLVNTFYERMRRDAAEEHVRGLDGTIDEDGRKQMAELAGNNIRIIESFVQACLMRAAQRERKDETLTTDDITHEAAQKWPGGQRIMSIDQIQQAVEDFYHIEHAALIGTRRNKELMEPRHVGIWLARQLTNSTLAEIGKHFGGRSHATVKHSIAWVDDLKDENRVFYERVETLYANVTEISV